MKKFKSDEFRKKLALLFSEYEDDDALEIGCTVVCIGSSLLFEICEERKDAIGLLEYCVSSSLRYTNEKESIDGSEKT